jgi:predicted DNA-binding ribbon-helix-helix protein
MGTQLTFAAFSDTALVDEVSRLAAAERCATARLIAALAEFDARRLYLAQGCSSLFVYCTRVLHLSEHAAYGRIEAARTGRRIPTVLEMLECGELTLTTIGLLASHLTIDNHRDVLSRAKHRTRREVEEIVASLRPTPDTPDRQSPLRRSSVRRPTVHGRAPTRRSESGAGPQAPDDPHGSRESRSTG